MLDNVRGPTLLAIYAADAKSGSGVPLGIVQKKVHRGRLSKQLIRAAIDELIGIDFLLVNTGEPAMYRVSDIGRDFVKVFYQKQYKKSFKFSSARKLALSLPIASAEFRALLFRYTAVRAMLSGLPLTIVLIVIYGWPYLRHA